MKWVLRIYAVVLMAYTGYRTWDFMQSQMPTGDYSGLLAIFFLFATEAGLFLFHEISLSHTTTHEQETVASALVVMDFIGSTAAGIADMILRQNFYEGYTMPPTLALFLVYGMPILAALNVAGFIYFERNDADRQLEKGKKRLRFEITRQAIKELKDNQSQIAASMKKDIYRTLRDEVTGKVYKQYGQEEKTINIESSSNGTTPVDKRTNGHKKIEITDLEEINPTKR